MNQQKLFLIAVAAIVSVLVGAIASPTAMDVIYLGLAAGAMVSPLQSYRCMSLAVILKYLNPELAVLGPNSAILFWVVLTAGSCRLLLLVRPANLAIVAPLWAFCLIAFMLSCVSSPVLPVSILKVITLMIVATAVICGFQAIPLSALNKLKVWMFALGTSVAVMSAMTIARPAVAYSLVKTSLQGILNHPQTLGTFLAPFAAWALCGMLTTRHRPKIIELAFLVSIWAVMLMTLARTAAIAAVTGVGVAFCFRFISGRRTADQAGIGKMLGLSAAALLVLIVSLITAAAVRTSVTSFILKRDAQNLDQSFYSSRGGGIESQWNNFLQKPLTGHGFGVYADGSFPDGVVEFKGIPISAPVEKGFIPTAILEETGIIGASIFWLFIFKIGTNVFRSSDLRWIAVFSAAVMVNVGEAVLLSPGGIGLHIWIMIAFAAAAHRLNKPHSDQEVLESSPALVAMPHRHYPNLLR
ncbi:MAG TPA: hypothetical protein VGN07_06925 [Steroidobacteraceae bacterium]|jgi:hypothetical protein